MKKKWPWLVVAVLLLVAMYLGLAGCDMLNQETTVYPPGNGMYEADR